MFARKCIAPFFAFLVAIGLASVALSQDTDDEPRFSVEVPTIETGIYNLPRRNEIKSVHAQLNSFNNLGLQLPAVTAFEVSTDYLDRVLQYFENPIIDRLPRLQLLEAGCIRIEETNGRVTSIIYYTRSGKGPLSFSLRGVRCYQTRREVGDNAARLDQLLRDAYRATTGHITDQPLPMRRENSD